MNPPGWGSGCAALAPLLEQQWKLLAGLTPRRGSALSRWWQGVLRRYLISAGPHHWSPPRAAPGPWQDPDVCFAWRVALPPECAVSREIQPQTQQIKPFCLKASPLLAEPPSQWLKPGGGIPFWLRREQSHLSGCLLPWLHKTELAAETHQQSSAYGERQHWPARPSHKDWDRAGVLPWVGTAAGRGWSSIHMLLATDTGLESIIQESLWSAAFLATADGPPFKEGFEASSAWGDFKPHSHISGKYPHLSRACRSL